MNARWRGDRVIRNSSEMKIFRYSLPLLVFVYIACLFLIPPALRSANLARDVDFPIIISGVLAGLPGSWINALLFGVLCWVMAGLSARRDRPGALGWFLHLAMALVAYSLFSIALIWMKFHAVLTTPSPLSAVEKAIDATWLLAFSLLTWLVYRDWLQASLRERHEELVRDLPAAP